SRLTLARSASRAVRRSTCSWMVRSTVSRASARSLGAIVKAFSCSSKTASRSAVEILFRQEWQTYFGVFEGTYIFLPQWQKVSPVNRWSERLALALPLPLPARIALQRSQISSETIAGAGVRTHSDSGFGIQCFLSPRDFV